jgi:predicted nucleotidyltransferase
MIDPNEKQVLADLVAIMNTLDLPMMVVGAGARLLIFDQRFGAGRGTKDWDVAISIDSWAVYETLRTTLIQGDMLSFKATSSDHKFIHIATNIEVDIVPFGAIGAPDQQIIWPDSGNPMNVWGFAEALDQAKTLALVTWNCRSSISQLFLSSRFLLGATEAIAQIRLSKI